MEVFLYVVVLYYTVAAIIATLVSIIFPEPKPAVFDIRNEVIEVWKKPIETLPVFIDLGRLIKRITISTISSSFKINVLLPAAEDETPVVERVRDAMNILSKKLEPEVIPKLKPALNKLVDSGRQFNSIHTVGDGGEMTLKISELFEEALPESSKITKLFKVIHQRMVFAAAYQVKQACMNATKLLLKDMRGPDGWKIEIVVLESWIEVHHIRREETINTSQNINDKFYLTWEMQILFDTDVTKIMDARVNIEFGPNVSSWLKKRVEITFPVDRTSLQTMLENVS